MELKFNEATTVRPNHLERCLCYDKFLKGYRCYVYDDISKYWCTQATTEHDPDGENHIVDYADYRVTEWASLQQAQSEVDLAEEIKNYFKEFYMDLTDQGYILKNSDGSVGLMSVKNIARHFYDLGLKAK